MAFSGSYKPRMLFFRLINVKMPTIVGILTFMRRKNFMLSGVKVLKPRGPADSQADFECSEFACTLSHSFACKN